jgi:glycosyltransferase involved in cell wall biosynthesis
LDECLGSLSSIASSYLQKLEVVISDNASTDNTREIVDKYQQRLSIKYFRNPENIGPDRNIMAAAHLGRAEYVWVFGDDDIFEEASVAGALEQIQLGYDLVVLNFSMWSRGMDQMLRPASLSIKQPEVYKTPNAIMAFLGLRLGYISSVIARKRILIGASPAEYCPFLQYGFAYLYSIYVGLLPKCRAVCLSEPSFKNRGDNSPDFLGEDGFAKWIRDFIYGTAYMFDALEKNGYSHRAVVDAKNEVLRDYAVNAILVQMPKHHRREVLFRMSGLYRSNWRFWLICLPALGMPFSILDLARRMFRSVRRYIRSQP